MELRHIRYFLAIAEERNFTRAAARIGIGQPPLSQQIRDLEREIGMPLFHRVPHGAELTPAGEAFREGVRRLPDQVADAVRAAQRAGRGETGSLRVGFTGSAAMTPLVPGTVRAFRREHPQVTLTLVEDNSAALAARLRDGSLDLAFLRLGSTDAADLHVEPMPDEAMILALPAGHPLVGPDPDAPVALADLAGATFVLTPRDVGPSLFDAAVGACRAVGFTPTLGQPAPQIASVLALVAAEEGVSIVPTSMRQLALAGVAYRAIADATPIAELSLVHPRASRSPLVRNFVAVARRA